MRSQMKRALAFLCSGALLCSMAVTSPAVFAQDQGNGDENPVSYVDTLIGAENNGACIAGPTRPNGSIHPSPETKNCENGGYRANQDIVGFGQLYVQGTGGTKTYGNFMLSPQVGDPIFNESDRASGKANEDANPNYYTVDLTKYDIKAEVTPEEHTALYRFTYPESDQSGIVLDISRKIGNEVALDEGSITIDPETNTITGGGTYKKNWNPAPYELYFTIEFSEQPTKMCVWDQDGLKEDLLEKSVDSGNKNRLGAYVQFDTEADEEIYAKISISFDSVEKAQAYQEEEVPGFDFDAVVQEGADEWNDILHSIELGENTPDAQKEKFYTALYHLNVQPRDRVSDHGYWDDFYTMWDNWKTAFPMLNIIRPSMVGQVVNSFIDRALNDGELADAFIQGKPYYCGQGNDTDNVITDAYLKQIPGVDWEKAYEAVLVSAENWRTENYLKYGYQFGTDNRYGYRLKPASATQNFAYNDWGIAQMAKGLGKTEDYEKYLARSKNWLNVWDDTAESDGFTGFPRARNEDGTFKNTDPKSGYDSDFYEATCWQMAYYNVYDAETIVEKMGGRGEFVTRLEHALNNNLIDFSNEPSFHTLWLFCNDAVQRPDLASYWTNQLLKKFPQRDYPGDEDNGAMSAMYMFLMSGFFPYSGTNDYYLHGTHLEEVTYHLENGKDFKILGENVSEKNIYVQSATLNGEPLDVAHITYDDIKNGGELKFVMGSEPSSWGRGEMETEPPTDIQNLTVNEAAGEQGLAILSWDASTDNDGVYRYHIYRGTTADFVADESTKIADTRSTTYTDTPADEGTYYYKVQAEDFSFNFSNVSEAVSVDIKIPPTQYGKGNLALNKPATATGSVKPAEGPEYAVDGDNKSKWSSKTTDEDGNYWLEVDLGANYAIDRWVVVNASINGETVGNNTSDCELQIKTGNEWLTVDSVKGNTAATIDRTIKNPVSARFVRLYITKPVGSNPSSVSARINEFQLYSPEEPVPAGSLTMGKEVQVNDQVKDTESGAQAVDGDKKTKWSCRSTQSDNGTYWLKVDLGKEYNVGSWYVYHAGSEKQSFITRDFSLQVSPDGETGWTDVDTVTDNTENITNRQLDEPVKGRYFRLHITKPTGDGADSISARIYEFHLYEAESAYSDITMTTDKDSYQINETITFSANTPSDVDGIGLVNENGKTIGLTKIKSTVGQDDRKNWTIQASLGTAGQGRTLTLKIHRNGQWETTDVKVTFDVTTEGLAPAQMLEAVFASEQVKVNEPVQVTVRTSTGVSKLSVRNENGRAMGFTVLGYEDQDDVRTWTIEMSVGTAGMRIFSFYGADYAGQWSPYTVESSIVITP
ncbi:Glycosyl hydrolase family 92 [Eubacteriaceae bacterium CHKCI005]|nr:Glycosyl hydrolase family 92 [Eubacteriaceae bacterium CHKCI005]